MSQHLINFTESSQIKGQSGSIESNCNSIEFINIGQDTFYILGCPILQGFSFVRNGGVGEFNITNYNITFANVAGMVQQCLVIRKIY